MKNISRMVVLIDGDPHHPLDSIARCDLTLARSIHQHFFPQTPTKVIPQFRKDPSLPRLQSDDLVLAGGRFSGAALANTPAKVILSLHTPGAPAKARIQTVAESYQITDRHSLQTQEKFEQCCLALSNCQLLCTNSYWTANILSQVYRPTLGPRFPPIIAECVALGPMVPPPPHTNEIPTLLSMVRASHRKRWRGLFRAADLLQERDGLRLRWHVLCGMDRAMMEAETQNTSFIFHDLLPTSQLQQLWQTVDLFVHPAHSEHLGLGILEALAQNIPVLVSRSGGPPTYLSEEQGTFFEPDNWEDLATQIAGLLKNPAQAQAQGRRGGIAIRARFSEAAVLMRLEPALKQMLLMPTHA